MKFFLDTADLAEIEEAASWGALAGVTTNPTLYARIGGKLDDFHAHIKRICDIVGPDCPVSAESVAMTRDEIVRDGRELAKIAPNVVVKIPTMGEGLALAAMTLDGGFGEWAAVTASSHFCSAERQFRFPLEYGGQRTPTSQWTVTGSGAAILGRKAAPPYVRAVTIGTITDMGITDANNMGAAMAPAAADTLRRFFKDSGMKPADFDLIATGDLGQVGSELLREVMEKEGCPLEGRQNDCGLMIYDRERQQVEAGGSGCGCSASVLCAYLLPALQRGEIMNLLFMATGALMSTTAVQQGESIPGIAHLVWLSKEPGMR